MNRRILIGAGAELYQEWKSDLIDRSKSDPKSIDDIAGRRMDKIAYSYADQDGDSEFSKQEAKELISDFRYFSGSIRSNIFSFYDARFEVGMIPFPNFSNVSNNQNDFLKGISAKVKEVNHDVIIDANSIYRNHPEFEAMKGRIHRDNLLIRREITDFSFEHNLPFNKDYKIVVIDKDQYDFEGKKWAQVLDSHGKHGSDHIIFIPTESFLVDDSGLRKSLAHEIAHAILHPSYIPSWIKEAMAIEFAHQSKVKPFQIFNSIPRSSKELEDVVQTTLGSELFKVPKILNELSYMSLAGINLYLKHEKKIDPKKIYAEIIREIQDQMEAADTFGYEFSVSQEQRMKNHSINKVLAKYGLNQETLYTKGVHYAINYVKRNFGADEMESYNDQVKKKFKAEPSFRDKMNESQDEEFSYIRYQMAIHDSVTGRHDKATQGLQRVKNDPILYKLRHNIYYNLARSQVALGHFDEAIDSFRRALVLIDHQFQEKIFWDMYLMVKHAEEKGHHLSITSDQLFDEIDFPFIEKAFQRKDHVWDQLVSNGILDKDTQNIYSINFKVD